MKGSLLNPERCKIWFIGARRNPQNIPCKFCADIYVACKVPLVEQSLAHRKLDKYTPVETINTLRFVVDAEFQNFGQRYSF